MNQLQVIGPEAMGELQEILAEAGNLMAGMNMGASTPEKLGTSHWCIETSDAITRASHSLGIMASREWHREHSLVSFAPVDRMPSEEDLILDLTWGQFDPEMFQASAFNEFFGPRREIIRYVGEKAYFLEYSAGSIVFRQVVHTPSADFPGEHLWLDTTPGQIASGDFQIGEVGPEEFKAMRAQLHA